MRKKVKPYQRRRAPVVTGPFDLHAKEPEAWYYADRDVGAIDLYMHLPPGAVQGITIRRAQLERMLRQIAGAKK